MALTKAQGNSLMTRLTGEGLRAADLTMAENGEFGLEGQTAPMYTVKHEPTGSDFVLRGPVPPSGRWSGSLRSPDEDRTSWQAQNWAQVLTFAGKWAAEVVDWQQTPDLWALKAAPMPDAADNGPFSQDERDGIAERLDEITRLVREQFALAGDQLAAIRQAVEELKEASTRVGRKDWRLIFYGTFVTYGLDHVLSSRVVETVFRLAAEGLGHIVGAGGTPMITA
jgi:hypothetical protein